MGERRTKESEMMVLRPAAILVVDRGTLPFCEEFKGVWCCDLLCLSKGCDSCPSQSLAPVSFRLLRSRFLPASRSLIGLASIRFPFRGK